MNKNFKIITINGFRGIITAIFIVLGLIAGFIISPGWVCMKLWNLAFEYSGYFSQMSLYQGIMLWAIIALSLYALNNKKALIGFGSYSGLSPEQIHEIMERTRKTEEKILREIKDKKLADSKEINDEQSTINVEETEEVRK